ncbi:hypothetical protein ACIBG5_13295 [Kribbella sp. NPDC050241]|uniref:hypothetical protein n=1 Tax=Kribbella sp. NPDC050241 TaxID=3364115 RepID=UPI0037B10A5D
MSLHRPAPAPPPTIHRPARRRRRPAVLSGVLAAVLVVAVVAVILVWRSGDTATTGAADSQLLLADGVTAGGSITGQARTLADALTERGLECSARFTSAEGGHSGCFAYRSASRTTSSVAFQYEPDGTVTAFALKVRATGDTASALRSLAAAVGDVVFPADLTNVGVVLQNWGGAPEGTWGKYEIISRGPKTQVNGAKLGSSQLEVPVLHLDTTEPDLAKALTADGYTCTADNETCQGKYAGRPGLALKFSGPDTGITYLVATAATGATTGKAFEQLRTTAFGHLQGDAVAPVQDWVSRHLDGRSHIAYVAGWRVDLEVTPGRQIRLTLFNEEIWLVMS